MRPPQRKIQRLDELRPVQRILRLAAGEAIVFVERALEALGGQVEGGCEGVGGVGLHRVALLDDLAIDTEVKSLVVGLLVVNFDGGAVGRRQHMGRQFGRSDVFLDEAMAVPVDEDRAERGQAEPEAAHGL